MSRPPLRAIAVASLCAMSVGTLAGCRPHLGRDGADTSRLRFAMQADPSQTLLPVIERSGGQLTGCLGLIAFNDLTFQWSIRDWALAAIPKTLNLWNDALRGFPLWTAQGPLQVAITVVEGRCPDTPKADVSVEIWGTARAFERDICPPTRTTPCAPGASDRVIHIGPVNRGRPQSIRSDFFLLHEFGHLMGLGDTYRIPGHWDWNGPDQKGSVMRGTLFEKPAPDDIRGLRAVVTQLKTGVRSCGPGAVERKATASTWGDVLCE